MGFVERGAFHAPTQRNSQQLTTELIGPRVVRAAKKLAGIAAAMGDELGAFVRTAVIQDIDLAIAIARHDDVLVADAACNVIAWILYLAFMTHINPGLAVDTIHFKLENFRVGINPLMHAVWADQTRNFFVANAHAVLRTVQESFLKNQFITTRNRAIAVTGRRCPLMA